MNPDQQNPERVRGFPVESDVEEGGNDAGENIPTTPPKSDQGSDWEHPGIGGKPFVSAREQGPTGHTIVGVMRV